MELLRNGRNFLVRVRTRDGAEGIGRPQRDAHDPHLSDLPQPGRPVLRRARTPASSSRCSGSSTGTTTTTSTRGWPSGSAWRPPSSPSSTCSASSPGKSIGDLLGGVKRREIAVYRASGNRGNTPEEEVAYLKQIVAESGAKALKFRLGGRMSKNADSLPGRTEKLIPLVREAFGPEMTLYADSNSSYDVRRGDPDRPADGGVRLRLLRGALPVRPPGGDQGGRRRPPHPGRRRRAGVQRVPASAG